MIGAGDVEEGRPPDAVFLRHAYGVLDFRSLPRDHDLTRGIQIRNVDIGRCRQPADGGFVAADHRRHRAGSCFAGRFHETSALFDQAQPLFKRERPGGGVRGPFA